MGCPLSGGTGGGGAGAGAGAASVGGSGDLGGLEQDGLEDGGSRDGSSGGVSVGGPGGDGVVSGNGSDQAGAGRCYGVVGEDTTDGTTLRAGAGLVGGLGESNELVEGVASPWGVDGANHAALAVVASSLTTVEPDGVAVLNSDGEGGGGRRVGGGDEAGEETVGQRLAGLGKARLDDAVVLGVEEELNLGSDWGEDVVGDELELLVWADEDLDSPIAGSVGLNDGGVGAGNGSKAEEGFGEIHN